MFWQDGFELAILVTVHVDDLLAAARTESRNRLMNELESNFGNLKVRGMEQSKTKHGYLIQQNCSLARMKPVATEGPDDHAADPKTAHLFRSVLWQLLHACQCHLEIALVWCTCKCLTEEGKGKYSRRTTC